MECRERICSFFFYTWIHETKLHNHFDSYRVNKINPRKEFFRITIDEIAEYVEENYDNTVSFTKIPVAKDYRDTIALMES